MIATARALRLAAVALALVAVLGAPPVALAGEPSSEAFLRLETGMHTAVVNAIAADGSGELVATASDDKTVRLWRGSDGAALGVLRVPIGSGPEGSLYAVAVSPDGKQVLAGGATGFSYDEAFCVYLFDAQKQSMLGRLGGLPGAVTALAYSPTGSGFALGMGGNSGLRFHDRSGKLIAQDTEFRDRVSAIAFDDAGRFAAASYDGEIRVYSADGKRLLRERAPGGRRPTALAFAPRGAQLAIGYDDQLRVDIVDPATLQPVAAPSTAGLSGDSLGAVAWTRDGTLVAAGRARSGTGTTARSWRDGGRGASTDTPVAQDVVTSLARLGPGRVAFASADPAWGEFGGNRAALRKAGGLDDFRSMNDRRFVVGPSGTSVEFTPQGARSSYRFDLVDRSLAPLAGAGAGAASRATGPTVPVANWRNQPAPSIGGHTVKLADQELARSVAALADRVLLGTDYFLRWYRADGAPVGEPVPVPAAAWALAVSPDQKLAVAALGDGTLRWYRLDPVRAPIEIAALFVASDHERWVMWTPEGLFDHADRGGKQLVGYQLNRGRAQAPEWIGFAQLYRAFYAPELLRNRVRGDGDDAVRQRLASIGDVRRLLASTALPDVQWTGYCYVDARQQRQCQPLDKAPAARTAVPAGTPAATPYVNAVLPADVTQVDLQYRVVDRGQGIGSADWFLNDRNVGRVSDTDMTRSLKVEKTTAAGQSAGSAYLGTRTVSLDTGVNQLQLRAYTRSGEAYAVSPPLSFYTVESRNPDSKVDLYVLTVAINKYKDPTPQLGLAVPDAKSFAEAVGRGAKPLYRKIIRYELYDDKATIPQINAALDDIASKARSDDTILVYLSGHGEEVDGNYYFITQEFDQSRIGGSDAAFEEAVASQGFSGQSLVAGLGRIKARNGFLFLDTCHAGAIHIDTGAARINQESGRYILVASQSVQTALDSYNGRNGVFAYAVLEALQGQARRAPGQPVDNFELGLYVYPRVAQLAKEKRHDQSASFKISAEQAARFPIAQP